MKEQTLYYLALISDFETFRTIESRLEEVSEFSTLKPENGQNGDFLSVFYSMRFFSFTEEDNHSLTCLHKAAPNCDMRP